MKIVRPYMHGQVRGGYMVLPMQLLLSLISKQSDFTTLTKVELYFLAHVN